MSHDLESEMNSRSELRDRSFRNCLWIVTLALFIFVHGSHSEFVQANGKTREDLLLVRAAREARLSVVTKMVRAGAALNVTAELDGENISPLMAACRSANLKVIEFLLQNGARVDFRNPTGETALIIASAKGDLETVLLLRKYGADTRLKDNTGRDAAIRAAEKGNFEIAELLATPDESQESFNAAMLIGAAAEGEIAILQRMIAKKANVNARAIGGETALEAAAVNCRSKIVDTLLRAGADVNIGYNSPLHYATENGCIETMEILLRGGANINGIERGSGWTPLMVASNNGNPEAVRLLLSYGSDPNAETASKETALSIARWAIARGAGSEEVVRCLLSAGAKR